MKASLYLKNIQQKVAECIIANAPPHVDTSHVKETFLRTSSSMLPVCVTLSTSSPGCKCNITVNFDPILCSPCDEPKIEISEESCNDIVKIDWDSYCRSIDDSKNSLIIYNEMLQLAQKIEEVLQQQKVATI